MQFQEPHSSTNTLVIIQKQSAQILLDRPVYTHTHMEKPSKARKTAESHGECVLQRCYKIGIYQYDSESKIHKNKR